MGNSSNENDLIAIGLDALRREIRQLQHEQEQTQDRLQRYQEQLDFLEALASAIGKGEPAKRMLAILTDRIRRLFQCTGTSVSLLSENGKTLNMESYVTTDGFQKAVEKIIGKSNPPPLPLDLFPQHKAALESCHPTAIHDLSSINNIITALAQITDLPAPVRKQFEKEPDYIRRLLGINAIL